MCIITLLNYLNNLKFCTNILTDVAMQISTSNHDFKNCKTDLKIFRKFSIIKY